MNTLKRKLTAILLTFAMLFSLMPALPQAAEAADENASNDSFSIQYNLPDIPAYDTGDVTVTLQDVAGKNIGEPLKISEYPKLIVTGNTFSLSDDLSQKYVIKGIRVSGNAIVTEGTNLTSFTSSGSSATFNFYLPGDSATITIILGEISDEPRIRNPLPESTSQLYRIYDDQILKMLYSQGIQVTKDTEINSVSPEWFSVFSTNGLNFTSVDGITDFRRLEVSDDLGEAYNVNPGNLKGLEITYKNGDGEQTATIPYNDLRFVGDQDGAITFYRIESANDDVHVVYFLDAYGALGATGPSNYDRLYDLRFVEDGKSLEQLPEAPDYGTSGYEFINWEIGSYDGSGQPLLSTTIINRDMIVYAHKLMTPEDSGTIIRVMNGSYDAAGNYYEDQLLGRIEELSNQEINWTEENKNSIKITVYGGGKQTNPEYLQENAWKNDYEYFEVLNYNAETGEWTPDDQNTHVRFDQIEYITVNYSIDGVAQSPVTINVGDQVGELSSMLQGGDVGTEQHVLILRLNLPGEVIDNGEEPEPGDELNGTAVTVQVVVDGVPTDTPLEYVDLSRNTENTSRDKYSVSEPDEHGVVTFDFNYNEDEESGHDCVDINVEFDGSKYALQGVEYNQSSGSGNPKVVTGSNGSYTIDNIVASEKVEDGYDVDCTIYLYTKYSVDYYLGETLLDADAYDDNNVYIFGTSVDESTDIAPSSPEDVTQKVAWKNDKCHTTITLATPLPTVENMNVSGWYLGSAEGTQYDPETEINVSTAITDLTGVVIPFYATSTDEPKGLTGLTKEVITEEVEDIDGTYQYPTLDKEGNPILSVDTGTEVTLLYKITVTGDKNVVFTVSDSDTTLVKVEGATGDGLALGTTDSYTGTITGDNGAVLYVAKNFGTVDSDRNLENTAAVVNESGGTQPDPDDDDEVVIPVEVTYTLNYNANDGKYLGGFSGKDVATVSGLKNGEYEIWTKDDTGKEVGEMPKNEILPVHDPVEENDVLFIGWSLKDDDKIYERGDTLPNDVLYDVDDKVKINNADVELYAVWGYDKDGGGTPDVFEDSYSLTYDANGGYGTMPVDKNAYVKGDTATLETEAVPNHGAVNDLPVVFLGWSTEQVADPFDAGENYGEVVKDSVTFEDEDITVYAVWGYDQNGDGTADAEQIVITPADIVAYTGGDGYTGVLNQYGEEIGTDTHGLPEPGFYFILPYELNAKLSADPEEMIDLSNSLRLSYSDTDGSDERSWTLKLYNTNVGVDPEDNVANEKYVYSMVAGETNPHPVRLEIRDEDGKLVTDDQFDITLDSLYETYEMKLYTDDSVDRTEVEAEYSTDNGSNWQDADVKGIARRSATLTIRGTKDNEPVNAIQSSVTEPVTEITAEDGDEVTYYVNGSSIPVVEQGAVQLLADSIVVDDDGETQETLENAIISSEDNTHGIDDSYTFDFSYLDLVDTSNGNAYATTGGDEVTIYWPYPEDMDQDDTFYVAHFDGLDRDFDGDVEAALADGSTELKLYSEGDDTYELETTENGIKFTTSTFSPFALVYDPDQNNGGNPGGGGGWHPGGGSDGPDGLNTEDHFSYVVGYEDGNVKPNNQITRAEVATIFYRLLEDEVRDEYDTTVNDFSDVSADSWYNQTVSTLASMEIVKGYEDGTFRPNASITRAEFAAIATRFFDETGATYEPGTFTDVTGDEWFAGAIMDAVNLGLIGGYEDGTVRPNNNITRAEACAIVNRTLGRVPDADHLLPADEMTTWPDNPSSAWFYADMQEATNGHEYEWITEDGNKIEEWTDILDKDWNDR